MTHHKIASASATRPLRRQAGIGQRFQPEGLGFHAGRHNGLECVGVFGEVARHCHSAIGRDGTGRFGHALKLRGHQHSPCLRRRWGNCWRWRGWRWGRRWREQLCNGRLDKATAHVAAHKKCLAVRGKRRAPHARLGWLWPLLFSLGLDVPQLDSAIEATAD